MHFQLFVLSLLTALAHAGPAKTEILGLPYKMAAYACEDAVSAFKFGANITSVYTMMCSYPPAVGSFLNCAANKLRPYSRQFNHTVALVSGQCGEYYEVNVTKKELFAAYDNATNYLLSYDASKNYTITKLYQPINIPVELIMPGYYYYQHLDFNFDRTSLLAGIMYLYFILIFILHGVSNLLKRAGLYRKFDNKLIRWYRANIAIPALFNENHTNSKIFFRIFSTLVPTRVESLVVFFFIALNLLLACFHYDFSSPIEERKLVIAEFIGDRTALLSFGLIPLIILLAGRNNIITSITGIPYTSLIFYHKWVARIMWIHAMIHSACWTAYGVYTHYLADYYHDTYWIWGCIATVSGGIILFQAFHQFRTMSYETFLVIHVVLVCIFIAGCWWHCYELGWLEWIYVSWALWGFDRVVRVIRMSLFGIKSAELKYLGDDTFRVKVPYNAAVFNPFPGSYAYLYFMTPLQFWQSHPFTVTKSYTGDNTLLFFIKAKTGITKSIRTQLESLPDDTTNMKVCIEGAYGHRAPVEKYDKVLLIAGGNGIPGIYSHAMDLAIRGCKQEVKLQWTIRNLDSLTWFKEELQELHNTDVQVDIFITRVTRLNMTKTDIENGNEKSSSTDDVPSLQDFAKIFSNFHFHYKKPDIDSYIKEEFSRGGTVAVMSCGPPKMVDTIRTSVARHLQGSKGRVDLFEELQVW